MWAKQESRHKHIPTRLRNRSKSESTAVSSGAFYLLCNWGLLRKQFHSTRHQVRSDVSVEHHDQAHDSAQGDRVPDHEAEDHAFVAHLIGGRGGNADRLRV